MTQNNRCRVDGGAAEWIYQCMPCHHRFLLLPLLMRLAVSSHGSISAHHAATLSTTLQKKDTSLTFGPNERNFCHTYDTSMTIIVTKPRIIIDVVGSYFYDKKS